MDLENLSAVRRLALVALVFNLLAVVVAALVLPSALRALVPVVALVLPMLSLAALEGAAERRLGAHFHA